MSNDLISRQAAIDEIINLWADKPFGNPALTEIKECVERVPSAQSEWIPCGERLPAPWTSVLVTYIYNGKRFVEESQYTGQDDERGNPLFCSYADEYKVRNAYFQKIAWMPLPKPYKG